jgi:hypothetical protein
VNVEKLIRDMQTDLKRSGRYVEDGLVDFIDRAHKEIVGSSKWTWLEVEVNTSAPVAVGPATYSLITLPLNADSEVDAEGIMWVKDYSNKRELWPTDIEPFNTVGNLPQHYRISPDGLELWLYPATEAIADLRYKYWRKLYDLTRPSSTLLIPDKFSDVVKNLALSYAFRGVDDTRSADFETLATRGMFRMRTGKFGQENARMFVKPDPQTQSIGTFSRGFDTSQNN